MTKSELLAIINQYGPDDEDEELDINEIMQAYEDDRNEFIEMCEERQHKSGMYVQQDLIDMYRYER